MSFPKCPRCNGKWIEGSKYESTKSMDCSDCKMIFIPEDECMWFYFEDPSTYLFWDLEDKFCYYVNAPTSTDHIETRLPMLDFKVSFEKVKLYVLFS